MDEVVFAVKTHNQDDLDYLEQLISSEPRYSKYVSKESFGVDPGKFEQLKLDWWSDDWETFGASFWLSSWEAVSDPETIYIKMDDDIVSLLLRGTLEQPTRNCQWVS